MKFHFKARGEGWQGHLSEDWGHCLRYVEVDEDRRASRQVEVYRNGKILKYSREHERDEFGFLLGLTFSLKEKWKKFFPGARSIDESQFEKIWESKGRAV